MSQRWDGWTARASAVLLIGASGGVVAWSLVSDGTAAVISGVAAALATTFVPTLIDAVRTRQEHRHQTDRELRGLRSNELDQSVAWLLHPEKQVIDFFGRADVLGPLHAWCADPKAAVVRLVSAPAGYGKTRLALRLAEELADWECWRIAPGGEADAAAKLDDGAGAGRLLLIVDYADSRAPAGLAALLAATARRGHGRVRLLGLARTAGHWWTSLSASHEKQATLIDSLTAPANVIHLPARADQRSPHEIVTSAVREFAAHLDSPPPHPAPARRHSPDTPLLRLHAEALLAVLGGPCSDDGRHDVVAEVLSHETRYWRRCARRIGLPLPGDPEEAETRMRRVVGVAALLGAEGPDQVAGIVDRALGAPETADDAGRLSRRPWIRWLRDLYPAGDSRTGAAPLGLLQPDLLTEHLTVGVLSDCTTSHRSAIFSELTVAQATQALTVLGRARLHQDEVETLVGAVLAADVRTMAYAVVRVAPHFPGLYAPRLVPLAATTRLDLDDLRALLQEIPYSSVELRMVALSLTTAINDQHTAELSRPEQAYWLNEHAIRLAEAGRRAEGLAASEEAVARYRELTGADRDGHLPELARFLSNHAYHLATAGQRQAALETSEEAVRIRRILADVDRDSYLPALAASVNNHAGHLAEAGQWQRALTVSEEAVQLRRELAEADRGYLPDLAISLTNHAVRLGEAGEDQAALAISAEAVRLHRELAETNRDAHLPRLAMSVNNYAIRLAATGSGVDALATSAEAVRLYRELTGTNREAYLRELAVSLDGHANRLAEADRLEQALAVDQEAIRLHRELAETNRDAHLPDLAMSLSNHAIRLAAAGRREPALTSGAESTRLRRELVAADREAHLPDLATSLLTESAVCLILGAPLASGVKAATESVELFAELTDRYPDAFDGRLQAAVETLAELHQAAGDQLTGAHVRARYGRPRLPGDAGQPASRRRLGALVEDRSL